MKTKEKVYVETSVISYFTGRKTKDVIISARQKLTKIWWETISNKYEAFISPYVIEEISKGNEKFSEKRLNAVKSFDVLSSSPEIEELAEEYFKKLKIPEKAFFDCNHLACAVISGMDIIVSWNFKHIVNFDKIRLYNSVNLKHGYRIIEIRNPRDLTDEN